MKFEWTNKKPEKPGWYWKRDSFQDDKSVSIIKLRIYGGKLCHQNWEVGDNCEWVGPIPEPS